MNRGRHPLALGIALIGFGLVFLLNALHVPLLAAVWRQWPLFLIAVGVWHLLPAGDGGRRRLAAPEQMLVGFVAVAGLVTTLFGTGQGNWHAEANRPPPVPVPPPLGEEMVEREELRAAIAAAATLDLEVQGAELDIQPGDDDVVTVSVASGPSDPSPGRVELTPGEGDRLLLRFVLGGAASQQARLTVRVPPDTAMRGRITDSALYARGTGAIDLEADGSQLHLVDVRGEVAGRIANGTLRAESIAGATKLQAINANLKLTSVHGEVEIRSSFTDVELSSAAGRVDIEASNARVSLGDIGGEARVRAPRCHILLRNLAAGGSIETTAGMIRGNRLNGDFSFVALESNVSLQNTSGSLKVHVSERQLTVVEASGEVQLETERSSVRIKRCRADLTVKLTGGDLQLSHNQGTIRAQAIDADLTLEADPGSPIELDGLRSNVGIRLGPAGGLFDLRAKAGSIVTSRDSSLSASIERRAGDAYLSGAYGSSRTPITGTVDQGIIRLIHR